MNRKKAFFELEDIVGIRLFQELLGLGLSRRKAGEHVNDFLKLKEKKPPWAVFIVEEGKTRSSFSQSPGEQEGKGDQLSIQGDKISIQKKDLWQGIFMINIDKIREEVTESLK